jgi:hypothetical protein
MSKESWERGYRDGKVGHRDPPPKPIFDPKAEDRFDYIHGNDAGQKHKDKDE